MLLDFLKSKLKLRNDIELAQALDIKAPLLGTIRQHRRGMGPSLLIRMNETTGITIAELKQLMGDRRARTRLTPHDGKRPAIAPDRTTWDRLARRAYKK